MAFYMKGVLYSLGSVGVLYLTLRYFFLTSVGKVLYVIGYSIFHDLNKPLTATAGGNPSLLAHLWFWLWAMIVFAGTFLVYLRRT